MKLTKNFDLSEFSCKDNTPTPQIVIPNLKMLAEQLQILRDYLDCPIKINSGYRSEEYNKKIGGAPLSQHKLGKAADISCEKYTPDQIHSAIVNLIKIGQMKPGGIGRYNSFIHYDIGKPRTWDLRN